jgi:hypothetical protein
MKHCLYYVGLFTLIVTGLEASASKGKAIYTKSCLSCHISAKGMASSKPAKTWNELLLFQEGSSNTLGQIHLDANKTKASWGYFESDLYRNESKHLKDFLQKYSSDRGKHNSCY